MKRLTFPWLTASVAAATIAAYIVLERGLSRPLTVAVLRQDGAVTAWDHLHPWTLVWAIFLHWSLAHVLTNMAVLVLVGTFLEQEISGWIWLLAYFASGIVGNLAQSLRLPPHDLAAGASGAIMGLLAVLAVVWFRRRNWPRLAVLLVLAGLEFAGEFQAPAHIAITAHLGGVAVGLLLGWLVPTSRFRALPPSAIPGPVRRGAPSRSRASAPAMLQVMLDPFVPRSRRVRLYVDGVWLGEIGRREPVRAIALDPGTHLVVFSVGFVRFAFHVDANAGQMVTFQFHFRRLPRGPRITWKVETEVSPDLREEAFMNG